MAVSISDVRRGGGILRFGGCGRRIISFFSQEFDRIAVASADDRSICIRSINRAAVCLKAVQYQLRWMPVCIIADADDRVLRLHGFQKRIA